VSSRFGEAFDPLVDSISRLTVFWSLEARDIVPMFLPLTMVFRDLVVAYSRILCATYGARISARWGGKIKAVVQGVAALILTYLGVVGSRDGALILTISYLVALVTALSSIEYVLSATGRTFRNRT
jgi:phosphatidylglycerophosphate synthase